MSVLIYRKKKTKITLRIILLIIKQDSNFLSILKIYRHLKRHQTFKGDKNTDDSLTTVLLIGILITRDNI